MPELPSGPGTPSLYQILQWIFTYEMKIVLARVLARVSLRLDPGRTIRMVRRGITFAPSGGVPVIRSAG